MPGELANHLWQSTIFTVAVALFALGFRKNRAEVRYWLWLCASFKFLLPFSLLIVLGGSLAFAPAARDIPVRDVSFTMLRMSRPFPAALPPAQATQASRDWAAIAIPLAIGLWTCGFLVIARIRFRDWRCIRAAVRSSVPMHIPATLEVRSSPGLLEPGVAGLFRPILLLPAGIAEHLTPRQFEMVIAHELCHARRRDNLTSAIHMLVEAAFWFHPLVWWIGARLVEERERACDEAVLSLGSEPREYAEGILNVCTSYLESPLSCMAGVTGSDLKKRIRAILTGHVPGRLNFARKASLAAAGIAALSVPVVIGIVNAPAIRAQSSLAVTPKFEIALIERCEAFHSRSAQDLSPGRLHSGCTTVERLIQQAFGLYANDRTNLLSSVTVTGGPSWAKSDFYDIDAKAKDLPSRATMNGPMLQALLEDRFKLKIHRETREVPVYALTMIKGGPEPHPFQGNCIPYRDIDYPPADPAPPALRCGNSRLTSDGFEMSGATMADLGMFFRVVLDRPVIDETGLTGRFNFHMELPTETLGFFRGAHSLPALSDPAAPATDPSLISAIKAAVRKFGLNLDPTKGPGEFIVIEHLEKPSGN